MIETDRHRNGTLDELQLTKQEVLSPQLSGSVRRRWTRCFHSDEAISILLNIHVSKMFRPKARRLAQCGWRQAARTCGPSALSLRVTRTFCKSLRSLQSSSSPSSLWFSFCPSLLVRNRLSIERIVTASSTPVRPDLLGRLPVDMVGTV